MAKMVESDIEEMALQKLRELGYTYFAGADIGPDGITPMRSSLESPILETRLREAIDRLNTDLPSMARMEAMRKVVNIIAPDLVSANEIFHKYLVEGVPVSFMRGKEERGGKIRLLDFDNPENNEFFAVNQFTIRENNISKRPDIVLFINGLPLVVIELKNPGDANATIKSAYNQLQTYRQIIPTLFHYNGLLAVSDGFEARTGSLSAGFTRFLPWKSEDGLTVAPKNKSQLEVLLKGMLNRETLLDILRYFTVFEKEKSQDFQGLVSIETVKKIAAYHQYYAVNKAVESTLAAAGLEDERHNKGGVVWHTQGSGKSLSMVFFSAKIAERLGNPTIVVLTDMNDLDDQLYDTFSACSQLLRQEPKQAQTQKGLKELLKVASGGIFFSTMQKFRPENGDTFDLLSNRSNIVVIADEAHRTQYGFKAHEIDVRNESGEICGKRRTYGLAKYLRDALPNAIYLAFTGTPIEKIGANTRSVFGDYIDIYDVARSVEDKATVPIYYESRLAKLELPEEGQKLIADLDEEIEQAGGENDPEVVRAKRRRSKLEALIGAGARLDNIARDIVEHFEGRQKANIGKGMIVCMSRPIAAQLYDRIVALRPDWHDDDLAKGQIKLVMTSSSTDGPELARFQTTKSQRKALASRMKNPEDPLTLAIVCHMWLTGFDVPCLHTMYLDKPLKGHTLMQAIARVNRVLGDKPGGLIVDYLGIAQDLKAAISFYGDSGGHGDPAVSQEQAVEIMLEKLDVVSAMLYGLNWEEYFIADVGRKLGIILETEDFILGLPDGKKRFLDAVTALSSAAALAMPHPQAIAVSNKISFLQAVKARLQKVGIGSTDIDTARIEEAIRQIIDQSVVSDKVIDVFDAAGIKKPDISILSDEFLQEMRDMPHKNLALETLKKLLNDEIKSRSRTNQVQGRKLLEMLQDALKRYHNKIITAAEIMEELIKIAHEIRNSDKAAEELGLTEYEYAFYMAVAENESARELMGKDKLRELAVELTNKVRQNAKIDWTIRKDIRDNLIAQVKRTLRKYGYPPDMQELATEEVIKQAERMAEKVNVDPLNY